MLVIYSILKMRIEFRKGKEKGKRELIKRVENDRKMVCQ